jgi:hypothetical protein
MKCEYNGYIISIERDEGIHDDNDLISIIVVKNLTHELIIDEWVESNKKNIEIMEQVKSRLDNLPIP